ncbi:YetF domain-containing protein [Bacillus atrophaeus]|uniref:YetF domain-containing protein n=1 Tax=Bacillus atrophaeus TaxID=1452 RepID=UPI001F0B0EDE|nr:YetF domain-containing protein [Bacillus atrophaeus]
MLSGKTITIVENGNINQKNLKKMRLTEAQLKMRLRQEGFGQIKDLEPNGQIGYELYGEAKPVRVQQVRFLLNELKAELIQANRRDIDET